MVEVKIRFDEHIQLSSFHNPLMEGKFETQEIHIRKDPLTGRLSIFNPCLVCKKAAFFGETDPALIGRLARESEPNCFICGERWRKTTPRYPEEMVPGGRVQAGEAILFPNLFPVSQVHAVIRVGSKHHLPIQGFSPQVIEEAFQAYREFDHRIHRANPTAKFMTLNANYLLPSGASIFHPHFQVLGSDVPFSHLSELLTLSKDHFQKYGTCYWMDLVEAEQKLGVRFVVQSGSVSWLTAFSPQGANEVLGILNVRREMLEMEESDISDLARGLSAVLRGYASMGFSTFNFSLYSGPLAAGDESFRCFLRVISRQNIYENYRTDDYFLQKLLRNELILTTPEELATILRGFF